LILSTAKAFSYASLFERVIDVLTMFLGTINRSWDKDKRSVAYLVFREGYTDLTEYEKADSFLHKALAITEDPERKAAALSQMGLVSKFSCNYDDALTTLNQALEILSKESREGREKSKSWSANIAVAHGQIGEVLS
jgi:tetratricopeptide (TPR) repeat protein